MRAEQYRRTWFAPSFDKPAGTTLKFTASGARTAGKVIVQQANLGLADLQAKLTAVTLERLSTLGLKPELIE